METYRRMPSELSLPRPGLRQNADINRMMTSASCSILLGIGILGVGILVTSSIAYDKTVASRTLLVGPVMICTGLFCFIRGIFRFRQERTCKCLQRNRSIPQDAVSPDSISNIFNQTAGNPNNDRFMSTSSAVRGLTSEMPPSYETAVGSNFGNYLPAYLHDGVAPPYDNGQFYASSDALVSPPPYEFAIRNNNAASSQ